MAVERDDLIEILPFGCVLAELKPPDEPNLLLRLPDEAAYSNNNPAYFGATIGRVANRIGDARVHLNGRTYELSRNGDHGTSCLHGGSRGWSRRPWTGPTIERRKDSTGEWRRARRYTYLSPHGDEGFPGAVMASAWWFSGVEEGKTVVEVEYEAEMLAEQPDGVEETVVSMTNHAYFNLSPTCQTDSPSLAGTLLTIPTTQHLHTYTNNIPTGEMFSFPKHSVLKPNQPILFGDNLPILDHCFILDTDPSSIPLDTRQRPLRQIADMMHPKTSVRLLVETTEPAFQLYTGDGIDVDGGTTDNPIHYGPRSGIAIEPGRYTNAANHKGWQDMVKLRRGQKWASRTRYTTWKEDANAC